MPGTTRITVTFGGHVQGVGFRYTVRNLANGFRVTGYVKNLSDGNVELVAEGDPDEVKALIAAVREEMAPYIRRANETEESPTGQYRDFRVSF